MRNCYTEAHRHYSPRNRRPFPLAGSRDTRIPSTDARQTGKLAGKTVRRKQPT